MSDSLPPAIRASDGDRDATVVHLREAMIEGRLTLDDFSVRTDTALRAQTRDELAVVLADLPPQPQLAAPQAQHTRALGWSPWVVGIMASAKRSGRWRVGHEIHAVAVMGECRVDLRDALIDGDVITVTAVAIMGNVDIIVPEGIEVDMQGIAIMGSKELRMKNVPPLAGAPRVIVTGIAIMGEVKARNQPTMLEAAWNRLTK